MHPYKITKIIISMIILGLGIFWWIDLIYGNMSTSDNSWPTIVQSLNVDKVTSIFIASVLTSVGAVMLGKSTR